MIVTQRPKQFFYGIIFASVFLLLAILVKINFFLPVGIDKWLSNFLVSTQTGLGSAVMGTVSFIGSPMMTIVYAVILAGIFVLANFKIPAIWTLATLLSGDAVGYVIKHLVARARPSVHLAADSGFSFPSGHALGTWLFISIIFVAIIPNINRATHRFIIRWALITFGALLMLSRIYLGAHFLSDTVAGALLAISWVALTTYLYPIIAHLLTDNIAYFSREEI